MSYIKAQGKWPKKAQGPPTDKPIVKNNRLNSCLEGPQSEVFYSFEFLKRKY